MAPAESATPIVVGIDGSTAAIDAALWAADEALTRGVPLRLVHVIDVESDLDPDLDEDPAETSKDWPETEHGKTFLLDASAAVRSTGKPVAVATELLWGDVDSTLIDESQRATMVCVGTVGIAPTCHRMFGSTAATLAEHAHCPVAVIRTPRAASTSEPEWIVAAVDDTLVSETVVDYALDEAHLRRAPVLALGVSREDRRGVHYDELERRATSWRRAHPRPHARHRGPAPPTSTVAQSVLGSRRALK